MEIYTMTEETEVSKVKFNGKTHTKATLEKLSLDDLLVLRNEVADALGVAKSKGFKTEEAGRTSTWKALLKFEASDMDGSKPIPPKEPKVVKGALPSKVKRPTKNMFRKIKIVSKPDRVLDRWDNYKDGMTILDTIEGDNMTPLDIYFYQSVGAVELIDPTEEEVAAGRAAWYKREGIENPDEVKARKAKEKAEEKAKRDAEKAEAKKKAEEAKAKKAAEKAKK